ncbi:uncharacterized protein [Rhodnius prolixus]|uniref:uncharacterized protein n=1 Tax=Rhodnius prolixus TaxID=13249 RepID=UPI003D18A021
MEIEDDFCRYCGRLATECPIVRSCTCVDIPRPMCDPRATSPCISCVKYRYTWLVIIFVSLVALPLLQHIMWRAHLKPLSDNSRVVNLYLMSGVLLINLWLVVYMVKTFDAKQAIKYQYSANK